MQNVDQSSQSTGLATRALAASKYQHLAPDEVPFFGGLMRLLGHKISAAALAILMATNMAVAADIRNIPMSVARWPTKADFLDATRQGEFSGIANLATDFDEELAPFILSIKAVLHADYGVPALPDWKGGCGSEFIQGMARIFKSIARVHAATVTDTAPDFSRDISQRDLDGIRDSLNQLQRSGGWCDGASMGKHKAHPYKAAAAQLAEEFNTAMVSWAVTERKRLQAAYVEDQRQRRADADARAAKARSADQQRIDAERARIEADEKRRQQAKKHQVGG